MTYFERELYNYFENGDKFQTLEATAKDFPGKTKYEIRSALTSLCNQGVFYSLDTVYGAMYGIDGSTSDVEHISVNMNTGEGMTSLFGALGISSKSEFVKKMALHPHEQLAKSHNDENINKLPLNDSSVLYGKLEGEICADWLNSILVHWDYLKLLKEGAAKYVKAAKPIFSMSDFTFYLKPEIEAIAEYRGIYLKEISQVLEHDLKHRLTLEQNYKAVGELLKQLSEYTEEDITINGGNRIAVPIPGIRQFKSLVDDFLRGGFSSNATSKQTNASASKTKSSSPVKNTKECNGSAEKKLEKKSVDTDKFTIRYNVLCKYSGSDSEVTIPDGVTSIGDDAFHGCKNLTKITIPDGVTSIGDWAFYCCENLTSITIPDSVTNISERAFSGCKNLTSITIPDSVISIGEFAFGFCENLTSITIPDSVTSIGDDTFSYCTGLESITVSGKNTVYHSAGNCIIKTASKTLIAGCKNSVIPSDGSVKNIDNWAFYGCENLSSIKIPDGVTGIGVSAFSGCKNLPSITIPDGVTSIGVGAFSDCAGLESIKVSGKNTVYHSTGNCLIETKSKTLIAGCKNSVIPSDGSVISIGEDAFYGCKKLNSITIPDSVTHIGDGAFSDCENLTSITIPDSVTHIGDGAFSDCKNLTSITIPDGVTSIGDEAFEWCENLIEITIPEGVISIGNSAFSGCENLTKVTIPDRVTSIGDEAFSYCENLTSITIPDSVTSIGDEAFSECENLTKITTPDGVISNCADALNAYCKANEKKAEEARKAEKARKAEETRRANENAKRAYENDKQEKERKAKMNQEKEEERKKRAAEKAEAEKREKEEKLILSRKKKGLCQYCGGEFKKGLFGTKCKSCGKKKDY